MTCQPRKEFADAKSVAQLAEPLRSRIAQAIADAPRGGLVLVSGKRTDFQQWLLWSSRCPKLTDCNKTCKGPPTTAAPGHSHHRNTDANHCAADMGGRDLDWLGANQAKYGLHRPVKGEKWHFEPHGTPTVRITPYGQQAPAPAPVDPNAGHSWRGFKAGDSDRTIYAAGGLDNEVAELQLLLGVPVTGTHDVVTVARWIAWQATQNRLAPTDARWAHRSSAVTADRIAHLRAVHKLLGHA